MLAHELLRQFLRLLRSSMTLLLIGIIRQAAAISPGEIDASSSFVAELHTLTSRECRLGRGCGRRSYEVAAVWRVLMDC